MAEIVNLRRARKERDRRDREVQADANRRSFGRTKAEKVASRAEAERTRSALEGKRLEADEADPETGDGR